MLLSVIGFDEQCFNDVYKKYALFIYRVSYHYLFNKDDAEDIVQELFLRYLMQNKTFNDDEHEKAWILRTTVNLCVSKLRSKSRETIPLDESIKISDDRFEDSSNSQIDLKNALSELSPNQRMAIYLFYYEQYTIKEIAKIMRTNENTVKSHLSRAKNQVRMELEKEERHELQ